ncbi:hypothetical protein [Patulibacter americanus]|uniref:hypothetical protein n=1 Tax=Patulibacter americanus TaxID=588672 RepID=UPI0003B55A3A|nr:hypothetical protein [Patulibacter americanus]
MPSSVSLRPGRPSAGSRGGRLLALVAVLVAALALAVVPFPGLARAAAADAPAAVRQAPLEDDGSDVADEESEDDGSVTDGEDDGSGLEEDDDLGDDLGDDLDDDLGDEEDVEEILPVVIDRGGRATSSPKAFVASRTVKGTKLRWKSWGSPTATGSGRLAFRTAGRKGKGVKGTGTVRLSRLVTCDDDTAVYRKATFAVPRRGRVVVTLPGCPASR